MLSETLSCSFVCPFPYLSITCFASMDSLSLFPAITPLLQLPVAGESEKNHVSRVTRSGHLMHAIYS